MTAKEKRLYHQIHPIKLFTDFSTAFVSTYLLWNQMLIYAIIIAFIPSIMVSIILIKMISLEKYRDSVFGGYLKKYMDSRIIDTIRFCGFFIMAIAGWFQLIWLIGLGIIVIVVCWLNGFVLPRTRNAA